MFLSHFVFSQTDKLNAGTVTDSIWMQDRLIQNSVSIEELKKYLSATPNPFGYAPFSLHVSPGLVRINEEIILSFKCEGNMPEHSVVTLEKKYLSNDSTPVVLTPAWKLKNGSAVATIVLTADIPGNWRIIWNVNGTRLSRTVAVVDKNYAICTLWSGTNKPIIDQEVHQYDLTVDQWMKDWWSPFDRTPEQIIGHLKAFAGFHQKYGQRIVPFVNADWILPGIANKNLMEVPTAIQQKGLEQMCETWNLLGIGPVEILGSYTFGSQTPVIAEKLGISAINSLCQWQNWRDGVDNKAWRINHWGAPIAPYFVADDDFRKAGSNETKDKIVAFGMGTASSVRNYSIYTMEGCPSLSCPLQRYEKTNAQEPNVHRFYVAVQGWLNDSKYQDEVFFTVGLENFMNDPDWRKANVLGVDYLVNCAKTQNLVFASAADIANYFQRHYSYQPEHFYFQPDMYSGYRCNAKPAVIADRIETSNRWYHSLHAYPDMLPQYCWDFTTQWDASSFEEQPALRNRYNLITPEVNNPDNCIPRMRDFRGITAKSMYTKMADGVQIQLHLTADKDYTNVPLALWDIPILPNSVTKLTCPEGVRAKLVMNGFNNIAHGIATISHLKARDVVLTFNITGIYSVIEPGIKDLGNGINGRLFHTDDKDYVYLWRQDSTLAGDYILEYTPGQLQVTLNDGTNVKAEGNLYTIPFDDAWKHETPVLIGKNILIDRLKVIRP